MNSASGRDCSIAACTVHRGICSTVHQTMLPVLVCFTAACAIPMNVSVLQRLCWLWTFCSIDCAVSCSTVYNSLCFPWTLFYKRLCYMDVSVYNRSLLCPWRCRNGLQQLVLHHEVLFKRACASSVRICHRSLCCTLITLITLQISENYPFIVLFSGLPPGIPYVVHLFSFSGQNYSKVSRNYYLHFYSQHFRKIIILNKKITV